MKSVLRAIARALASIPRMAWTVCKYTGAMVLSLIPQPAAAMTTAAGDEADEAIQAARARQEKPAAPAPSEAASQAKLALTYAAAIVTGSRPPDVSAQPESFKAWLADLTPEGARRLFKCSMGQIERHIAPRCPGDHLDGVPSIGIRPMSAAPVRDGSKLYLDALAKAPRPEMCSDGDFRIFHGHDGEDQSTRLRAA